MSYLMQDDDGQTVESHSISAGLDYPSVGPEHSYLRDTGRAEYRYATDDVVMEAFRLLCRTEGIIPALESAHALVGAMEVGRSSAPTPCCWSTSPVAATRTWRPPRRTSASSTGAA